MVVKRKNTWISIGMIYACSVIGVGFASGNEIIHFFTSYGMSGFYGILTASAIFSFVGFLLVNMCFRTGSYQLSDCYKATGGPFFASFAGLVGTLFSFCLFFIVYLIYKTNLWQDGCAYLFYPEPVLSFLRSCQDS